MAKAHVLGFPRIGVHRELKVAVEDYWKGRIDRTALLAAGRELRARHWALMARAGVDLLPVGDFSWYDNVLDTSLLLGVVPERFGPAGAPADLDTGFRMARGRAPTGPDVQAEEMTKWFDTNYHYLVPELAPGQRFRLSSSALFDAVDEVIALGHGGRIKPVLLGPLTFLWLAKAGGADVDRLSLLAGMLPVYTQILQRLQAQGVTWVQVDEPILVLDLPETWREAVKTAYDVLGRAGPKVLLATYFGGLDENVELACHLPVAGLHVDLVRAPGQLGAVLEALPADKVLSAGVVDGRNVWRTDLGAALQTLEKAREHLGDRLWVAPSCSLLHVPVDLDAEKALDPELRRSLAFATQKVGEVMTLRRALTEGRESVAADLADAADALANRRASTRIHRHDVAVRIQAVTDAMSRRASPFPVRRKAQRARLGLPPLPTTTIGSFPQTPEIRIARRDFKAGKISAADYRDRMRDEIRRVIRTQEDLGLDVLVHGEPERNDMVEYFGERLDGVAFTSNGWVQSYGSRCVKPPVIFGDVARPAPMTVEWATYAQSLTAKPVKGMLTGPVTILEWSFVRDDQPRETTALQIALALRDEVADLEAAGIGVIQIDEPAFREGMPLRQRDRSRYLDWAGRAFRVASSGTRDDTQIHTHMCYAEFNDILPAIAALDADVISIEASRSGMVLLEAFERFEYPNEVGPGVWDVHSPHVPSTEDIAALLRKAARRIPADRLWVNPDCGLKTRDWPEVRETLVHLVAAAKALRAETR